MHISLRISIIDLAKKYLHSWEKDRDRSHGDDIVEGWMHHQKN